jgi:transposase
VRPQQDKWPTVYLAASEQDPCLAGQSRGEVMARARDRAADLGLDRGGRLLSTAEWADADAWVDALFVPLAIGGSVVLVRNAGAETLDRRAAQERADLVR